MSYKEGISVIIPICNAESYLKNCLNSVTKQTLSDLEIICVLDKKSYDNSEKILNNFSKNDKRIKVIKDETGKGQGYNRNLGIEQAECEYIGFVDADDFIDQDFYERLYDYGKIFSADVVQSEIQIVNSETRSVIKDHKNQLYIEYNTGKIYALLKEGCCTDKIFRTSLIKEPPIVRFSEDKVFEQYPFVLSVLSKSNKFLTVQGSYYYWVQYPDSLSFLPEYFEKRKNDANAIFKDIFEILARTNSQKEENKIILKFMLEQFGMDTFKDQKYNDYLTRQIEKLIR